MESTRIQNNQGNNSEEEKLEANLKLQYQECLEFYRMYDKHAWQIPSLALLITSVIIGVSFGYLRDDLEVFLVVFAIGIIFSFMMIIKLHRNRFYQTLMLKKIVSIQEYLKIENEYQIPLRSLRGESLPDTPWPQRLTSYLVLRICLYSIFSGLLLLVILHIVFY